MRHSILLSILMILNFLPSHSQEWESYPYASKINDIKEFGDELWIATNVGLIIVDRSTGTAETYHPGNSGIPSTTIESITEDATGRRWIGTYDARIATFEGGMWEEVTYPDTLLAQDESDPDPLFYSILNQEDTIWIASNFGMIKHWENNWEIVPTSTESFFLDEIWALSEGSAGEMYAAGNVPFKYQNGSWTEYDHNNFEVFAYSHAHAHYDEDYGLIFTTDIATVGMFLSDSLTAYTTWDTGVHYMPLFFFDINSIAGNAAEGIYISDPTRGIARFNGISWDTVRTKDNHHTIVDYYFIDASGNHYYIKNGMLYGENTTAIDLSDNSLENTSVTGLSINDSRLIINNNKLMNLDNWEVFDFSEPLYDVDGSVGRKVWVAGSDHIFFIPDISNQHYLSMEYPEIDGVAYFNEIVAFSQDDIYVKTYTSIYHFDGIDWTLVSEINDGSYRHLSKDVDGNVWVTQLVNGGTCEFNAETRIFKITGENAISVSGVDRCGYNLLTSTSSGDIYYSNRYGVVSKYNADESNWETLDLSGILIETFYLYALDITTEGHLIMATSKGLIDYYDGDYERFSTANSELAGLPLLMDYDNNDGKIWMTVWDFGLQTYQTMRDSTADTTVVLAQQETLLIEKAVYPNPATDQLTITLNDDEITAIELTDQLGRQTRTVVETGMNNISRIDVSDLVNGIYFISISGIKRSYCTVFIKH